MSEQDWSDPVHVTGAVLAQIEDLPLAGRLEVLTAALETLETAATLPLWEGLAAVYNGRVWKLARGTTFVARDLNAVYVSVRTCRDWNTGGDRIDSVNVTVYGEMRTSSGRVDSMAAVEILYPFHGTAPQRRQYTRANMPDGARQKVADAVAAEMDGYQSWRALAAEAHVADRAGDVRGCISAAVRSLEDAVRTLARPHLEVP